MVYPSRPDEPTTSGWLQMIETDVSFLSSTNKSSGALVGSGRKAEHTIGENGKCCDRFNQGLIVHMIFFRSKKKKPPEVCPQSLLCSLFNGGLPLGGGGGGVGGLGSSDAAASGASPDVKQALLSGLLLPAAWVRKY